MALLPPELKKATDLYEKTREFQYGNNRNKAARTAYDEYIKTLAEKHKSNYGNIHTQVILERRKQRLSKTK